jgi:hypothetical protein
MRNKGSEKMNMYQADLLVGSSPMLIKRIAQFEQWFCVPSQRLKRSIKADAVMNDESNG